MRLAAVTGGGGFLGRWLVEELAAAGWRVRVLMRREAFWRGAEPEVVLGDLADPSALKALCRDADAVFHLAGLIRSRTRAEMERVNVEGAAAVAAAARAQAPGAPFVHVSSLAAREPALSLYACTKRRGEARVAEALDAAARIVRPPVIYGPGDVQTFRLFVAAASLPVLPLLHPEARLALMHAQDAARQIVALADHPPGFVLATIADERPEGYAWAEIMQAAACAVGRRPATVRIPEVAARAVGLAGDLARALGANPMATSGKMRELLHRDWAVRPRERTASLPAPRFDLSSGFADTVAWGRRQGSLPR